MMSAHCPPRPLVGIVCDRFLVGEHDLHSAKHSYVSALTTVSEVSPVLIPASEDLNELDAYLNGLCGLLFPGGASNVDARRYGKPASTTGLVDHARDHVALKLMHMAAARGMPFLAICRGFQEMNVAFGGTLDANIYASGRSDDHRESLEEDLHTRYRYKHDVTLADGGILQKLTGKQRIQVNSLHTQGIADLAPSLVVEALAPDGLIESFRFPANDFAVGVQWHPEVTVGSDAMSRSLFQEFGRMCRRFKRRTE